MKFQEILDERLEALDCPEVSTDTASIAMYLGAIGVMLDERLSEIVGQLEKLDKPRYVLNPAGREEEPPEKRRGSILSDEDLAKLRKFEEYFEEYVE